MSFHKLAALGALGASAGLLALYGLLVSVMLPSPREASNLTNVAVTLISVGGVIAALVFVHLLAARQLFRMARDDERARQGGTARTQAGA